MSASWSASIVVFDADSGEEETEAAVGEGEAEATAGEGEGSLFVKHSSEPDCTITSFRPLVVPAASVIWKALLSTVI